MSDKTQFEVWGQLPSVDVAWQRWINDHASFTDDAKLQARRLMALGDLTALRAQPGAAAWTLSELPHARGWAGRVRVYFTGFEPFGGHDVNPSQEVAREAARHLLGHDRLFPVHDDLPVTYTCAHQWPKETAASCEVDEAIDAALFVHVGLAADRHEVCFERSAYNETSEHTPDNAGVLGGGPLGGGVAVRQTALDVDAMVSTWRAIAGEVLPDARVSDDAGRYICNAIFYNALTEVERIRRDGHTTDALFVHVPAMSESLSIQVGACLGRVIEQVVMALYWS